MPRPVPTLVLHMTRLERLPSVVELGLLPDNEVVRRPIDGIEIGYRHIKDRRAHREVPCGAGGTLADYVPFYFAPRSPMLFAITRGQVSAEAAQTESIVYLAASVQALRAAGLVVVTRDRKERRQAECLVYPTVPWALFEAVVTKTDNARRHIESLLANSGRATPVLVRPNWYF